MIRNILLSLLVLCAVTSAAVAAPETFNDRKANLAEFHAIRIGYGSGTVRLVLDLTKKVTFKESYVENPSRMIVDLQNTWLNPTVQREIELKSTAAKKIRIAQFDPTTVRIVIETMADTRPFFLTGGNSGWRFVIDVGNSEFKAEPELNKTNAELQAERERELQAERERELQAQRERELQAQRERELQAQREKELQAQRERELQAQRERELQAQRERELQAQRERELQAQREKELQDERERKLKQRELEVEKREQAQRERELKEKREQEIKAQREREKELKEQEKREKKERERLEKEKREREKREAKEREREKREAKDKDKNKSDKEREVDQPFTELDKDLETLTALKGKKIAIDPGHGGNDSGAIGPTGVMEKNVTLNVALELKKLLEAEGAQVIMTRQTDSTVSPKGAAASDIEELGARCEVANRNNSDIFISIHADAFTRPEARGTTAYYYSQGAGRGQKLADCIRRNLVEQLGTPSRGTQPCNFYVVKHTDMPATLIELGFISNKDEEKLLDSADGVKRAAQGILDGIEDYFG